jgi:anthranilate synthase component 1
MLPRQSELNDYANQGYNRVPLVREVLADFETPLSVYCKLADQPYSYLFESVQGGEKWGRYSIIGLPCAQRLEVRGNHLQHIRVNEILRDEEVADPLAEIENFRDQFKVPAIENLPRFSGGLVGYFGFEIIQLIEPRLAGHSKPDDINAPDIVLMVSDELVVFDNLSGRLHIITHIDPGVHDALNKGKNRLDIIEQQLHIPLATKRKTHLKRHIKESDFISSFTEAGFKQAVDQCKQYIYDGDIFQVVLSQQMSTPFNAEPLDFYRALRTLNPSPYMYLLNLGEVHIAGSSPEILVRLEGGEITVRPIAGTRKRGRDEAHDLELEKDLLSDPKELAEHLMLVDLGRNDCGRVAQIGTVEVTERDNIERYSHVMHIVSNVVGKLKPELSAIDVLRATFPAGTVSGAPKIRAMEIIQEFEPVKRGIYSGAIGYIGWNGNMDTAIAIRTAIIKNNTLTIQAGAGIVADSKPELEWMETMNKGRAIFKAAALAESGLDLSLDDRGHK